MLTASLGKHPQALGLVHGCLDLAIQRACAPWADGYADLRHVKGGVLAGDIRQWLLHYLDCQDFQASSLMAAAGSNCSVALSDVDGQVAVVRKHPRSYVTGELTAVTEIAATTLFGIDYSQLPWEPFVLWDADLKRQVLSKAWLAAVSGIDDPAGAVIYCKCELPAAIFPAVRQEPTGGSNDDFWQDDDFGDEEGEGTGDPA